MTILLLLVLAAVVALVVRRFQVAARGQHIEPPHDLEPAPLTEDHLPLRPSAQVDRARWAADGTHVRAPHVTNPGDEPF